MMDFDIVYLVPVFALAVYVCGTYLNGRRRRAALVNQHGCLPAPPLPQHLLLNGLDLYQHFQTWAEQKTFIKNTSQFFLSSLSSAPSPRTITIRFLGTTRIWTICPQNIKALLQSNDFELGWIRIKAFRPYLGSGPQASNGHVWAYGRALLRRCFTRAQVSNFPMYETHFGALAAALPADGQTFDLQPFFSRLTMDVITEMLFGESVACLRPVVAPEVRELELAFETATKGLMKRFNMGNLIWFARDGEFDRALRTIHQYAERFVEKALVLRQKGLAGSGASDETKGANEGRDRDQVLEKTEPVEVRADGHGQQETAKSRYIFLEALAQDTGDRTMIRDQLVSVFAAGRNSTAALLSLIFYQLVRHTAVMQRLRDEVSEQLGGRVPEYDDVREMAYLKAVVDETLRTLPPAAFNERQAKCDTVLPVGGGPDGTSPIMVRKGQTVLYHTYALHRDPTIWGADADEFRPERWEELRTRRKEAGVGMGVLGGFVPFGSGGRMCPGQQLALMEASYFTIRMLQTFSKIDCRDSGPLIEGVGVVFHSGNGVKVGIEK